MSKRAEAAIDERKVMAGTDICSTIEEWREMAARRCAEIAAARAEADAAADEADRGRTERLGATRHPRWAWRREERWVDNRAIGRRERRVATLRHWG